MTLSIMAFSIKDTQLNKSAIMSRFYFVMTNVVKLSVFVLSVVMLSVAMLSVVMLSDVMLLC